MKIEKKHFIDSPPPSKSEREAYYSEGDNYILTLDDVQYKCRSYSTRPKEMIFISRKYTSSFKQFFKGRFFTSVPYDEECFVACIDALENLGFSEFAVLLADKEMLVVELDKLKS